MSKRWLVGAVVATLGATGCTGPTPQESPILTQTPTPTPSPSPTQSGSPTPTPNPTQSGSPTPTPNPTQSGSPTPAPTPPPPLPGEGSIDVGITIMTVGSISADCSVAYTGTKDGVSNFTVIETGERLQFRAGETRLVAGVPVTLISGGADSATLRVPRPVSSPSAEPRVQVLTMKASETLTLDDGGRLTLVALHDQTVTVSFVAAAGTTTQLEVGAGGVVLVGGGKLTLEKLTPSPMTGARAIEAKLRYVY